MPTAGDPAPSTVEPRTPTPYRAIGAGALSAAAISVLALSATAGQTLHEPAPTSVILLSVGVVAGIVLGLWGLQQHRYGQRVRATSAAEEARYAAWLDASESSELWHAQQYQALGAQHERIEGRVCDMAKDIAASVAGQLRADLSDEIARAVRSAHAAGYIAGVAARQSAAVGGVNGSSGGHLRLIDTENPS